MSATLRIDTLKFAKRLADAGLSRQAAEAIVEGLSEADLSEIATKADIGEVKAAISDLRAETRAEIGALRADTKAEIGGLRAETKADIGEVKGAISDLRADIYGRLWVMGVGIIGLTVGLIKLLPG